MELGIEGNIRFVFQLINNVFDNVLKSQNIFIKLLFQESDQLQYSWTFQKPTEPYMVFMQICDVTISNNRTIPEYKSTFIYTNINQLQFIRSKYNSHCYTCSLQAKTDTCNVDKK